MEQSKYDEALRMLTELCQNIRPETVSGSTKMANAKLKYLVSLCYVNLNGVKTKSDKDLVREKLYEAADSARVAVSESDQLDLINIWESLGEYYYEHPNFIEMEHGHKCMEQVFSSATNRILKAYEKCEITSESVISIVHKSCRILLELECALSDPKSALGMVEWSRNCILLGKIPNRRLAEKLSKPITLSYIEQVVDKFSKDNLFLYFAHTGKNSSQAFCLWGLVPKKGVVFFSKISVTSAKPERSFESLVKFLLKSLNQAQYSSEMRLILKYNRKGLPPTEKITAEDRKQSMIAIGDLLFSRLPTHLLESARNIYIVPDGPLLALTTMLQDIFHNWLKSFPVEKWETVPKIFCVPSLLTLGICMENVVKSVAYNDAFANDVRESKLGGLYSYFHSESPRSEKPIGDKSLARPNSSRVAIGAHTISTLVTNSAVGSDICSSTLFPLSSTNAMVQSEKAILFGYPHVNVGAKSLPPPLVSSQKEVLTLARQLHSHHIYLGEHCSKKNFLQMCSSAKLVHLATYMSFFDGIVGFVKSSPPSPDSTSNYISPNKASPDNLIASEIANMPMTLTRVVALSACPSVSEALESLQYENNHLGNSLLILPTAFLFSGCHLCLMPNFGWTDDELLKSFSKSYSQPSVEFQTMIGIDTNLNVKQLSHDMLDQDIQEVISQVEKAKMKMEGESTFPGPNATTKWEAVESWMATVVSLIDLLQENRPCVDDFSTIRSILTRPANEIEKLPQSSELRCFLKWLGFHLVLLDTNLKTVVRPLQHDEKAMEKAVMLMDATEYLFHHDFTLGCSFVDLVEDMTQPQLVDLINLFSTIKHTTFPIRLTDETALRIFEMAKTRSFLSLIGFVTVQGQVLFSHSPENTKRFDIIFKVFVAMAYDCDGKVLEKFIPFGANDEEEENKDQQSMALKSLNLQILKTASISSVPEEERSKMFALEPLYHYQDKELTKDEVRAKVKLANDIKDVNENSKIDKANARRMLHHQLLTQQRVAVDIKQREIEKLPNRSVTDRIKVEPGRTPSQARVPIDFKQRFEPKMVNEEREKLVYFFAKSEDIIEDSRKQAIDKLASKYLTTKK